MSDSIHNQYVTQVFQGQLDHYAPYAGHVGDEEKNRPTPVGLSKRDERVLHSVREAYHFLDEAFHLCGLSFGWSFIIAFLIPVAGALIEFSLSYQMLIKRAERADIPKWLKSEMLMNILFGAALSLVPFVGRIAMALFGPNSRNEKLFEEYMRVRGALYVQLRGSGPLEANVGGYEWWKALAPRAEGSGITGKDVRQIKPGAGMTLEEFQGAGHSLLVYGQV